MLKSSSCFTLSRSSFNFLEVSLGFQSYCAVFPREFKFWKGRCIYLECHTSISSCRLYWWALSHAQRRNSHHTYIHTHARTRARVCAHTDTIWRCSQQLCIHMMYIHTYQWISILGNEILYESLDTLTNGSVFFATSPMKTSRIALSTVLSAWGSPAFLRRTSVL